jgi:hypothetical protein
LTISAPGEASGPVTGGRSPILIGGFCCCASAGPPASTATPKAAATPAAAHKNVFLLVSITRLPDRLFRVFLNHIGSSTPLDPALAHPIGLGHDPDVITYH